MGLPSPPTQLYLLSHLAKAFLTEDGWTAFEEFFTAHNIEDPDSYTLFCCEEAVCVLREETAATLQDHLPDLMRLVWDKGAEVDEDFPAVSEDETIPDGDTNCHWQLNDDTLDKFAREQNLTEEARDELQELIEEHQDYVGSTDGIYLELQIDEA